MIVAPLGGAPPSAVAGQDLTEHQSAIVALARVGVDGRGGPCGHRGAKPAHPERCPEPDGRRGRPGRSIPSQQARTSRLNDLVPAGSPLSPRPGSSLEGRARLALLTIFRHCRPASRAEERRVIWATTAHGFSPSSIRLSRELLVLSPGVNLSGASSNRSGVEGWEAEPAVALAATVGDASWGANKLGGHPPRAAGPAAYNDILRVNCALGFARAMAVLHDSASASCDGCGESTRREGPNGTTLACSRAKVRTIEPAPGNWLISAPASGRADPGLK
jgi:hypothetical protein